MSSKKTLHKMFYYDDEYEYSAQLCGYAFVFRVIDFPNSSVSFKSTEWQHMTSGLVEDCLRGIICDNLTRAGVDTTEHYHVKYGQCRDVV
jgi:hypothetical protein